MPPKAKIASTASETPLQPFFRTQFDSHTSPVQEPGSRMKELFSPKLMDDGTIELIPSGVDNLYAQIQSHKDSCDIHVLLKQYALGDDAALSKAQGTYGDFTTAPKSFMEALNAVIAAENMFEALPLETREKFDFSLEKFIVGMDNMPDWLAKVGQSSESQGSTEPQVSQISSKDGDSE